jgi:GNAT superfamily N-acetyltransferase
MRSIHHDHGEFEGASDSLRQYARNTHAFHMDQRGAPGRFAARERLAAILRDAAAGRFPPADGEVTVLAQPSPRDCGVFGFTAHAVIFIDADPDWVRSRLPPGDLGAPLNAAFLQALCDATGRVAGSIDVLCVAQPLGGPPPVALIPEPDTSHPRIERALHYREGVRAWRTDGGLVLIGQGVAGRLETAIEVDEDRRERGLGRALARAARHLANPGEPLWAQVAAANAASVRAFLAAGFTPVGAEVLLAARAPG